MAGSSDATGVDSSSHDAALCADGVATVRKLAEQLGPFPELVVTSPMTCALQTALLIFGSPKRRLTPHKLLRETPKTTVTKQLIGKPQTSECIGRVKAELLKHPPLLELEAPNRVAWEELEEGEWWSSKILSNADTQQEAASFRQWLLKRDESRIAVVGHIGKLGHMLKHKPYAGWPKNAVSYFCHLITTTGSWLAIGDLMYGGTTEEAAKAVKPPGVESKLVLILRHGKTLTQETNAAKQAKRRAASLDMVPPLKRSAPSADHPLYGDQTCVRISGIEKKPELNGKLGVVVSYIGGPERRYTVRIDESLLSLREDKLSATGNGGKSVPRKRKEPVAENSDSEEEMFARCPLGQLTAQGQLIPTYSWVKVPSVAVLPPGLEVRMPLTGMKFARIPSTWRLQLVADGQCDTYRCDVTRDTLVSQVVKGAAKAFGWETNTFSVQCDGKTLVIDDKATVGGASLFGRKLTAVKQT